MLRNPRPNHKFFQPDYIASSVGDIDFAVLAAGGIKAVFIDLDGTVVSSGSFEVDQQLTNHLKIQPLKIYIATNRSKDRDLQNLRESLHASGVIYPGGVFAKPLPRYYSRAVAAYGLTARQVAMVGNRFVQDIFGGNWAGLTTVLVRNLGTPKNYFDAKLSAIENRQTDKLATWYVPCSQPSP
jgi:HAD superfamily phosphatase (TIGR01668 family)